MKDSIKIILISAFVCTLGLVGLARNLYAKQPQSQVAIIEESHKITQVAKATDGETNDDAQESLEAVKLQPLAKITAQQAKLAAEIAEGAKASSVKLENESGNLAYTVVIGQKEVKVDAGNSKVLYIDGANNETDEASRPPSSIQVSQSSDPGDGEINHHDHHPHQGTL